MTQDKKHAPSASEATVVDIIQSASPPRPSDATIIDAESLESARQDPMVQEFLKAAREYGQKMKREGRDRSWQRPG